MVYVVIWRLMHWHLHTAMKNWKSTSANSLMLDLILLTRAGVSDTRTTFGLDDIRCWLRMAFLMQCNAACTALTDLKKGCEKWNQSFKPISYEKVERCPISIKLEKHENVEMPYGSFSFGKGGYMLDATWIFCVNTACIYKCFSEV